MPRAKAESRCPRRVEDVVWKTIGGKGVLLKLDDGEYFEIDPVGLEIWNRCDGKTSVDAIAAAIAEDYGVDLARVHKDVVEFLADLSRRRLLDAGR